MDASLLTDDKDGYTITANISNNSLQPAEIGIITADMLDSEGEIMVSVELNDTALTLGGEAKTTLTAKAPELAGKPVQIALRSSEKSVIKLSTNADKDTAGKYDITVSYQENDNYTVTVVNGNYTIKTAPETTTTAPAATTIATTTAKGSLAAVGGAIAATLAGLWLTIKAVRRKKGDE